MTENTIRILQERLRLIGRYSDGIDPIAVDGIYNAETEAAVRAFQQMYGLPVTGQTDADTWEAVNDLYTAVLEQTSPPRQIAPFPNCDTVLRLNDASPVVTVLQVVLLQLSQRFTNIPSIEVSGIYDMKTVTAVKELQRSSALEQTGETDKRTWNAVASLFNAYYGRVC